MSQLKNISYLNINTINVCKEDVEKIKKIFLENNIKASFHLNGLEALCEIESKFRVENNFAGTQEETYELEQEIEKKLNLAENILDYEVIEEITNKLF